LVGTFQEERPRLRSRWKDNIKIEIDEMELEGVNWFNLSVDWDL
jgi:hypothetical protein